MSAQTENYELPIPNNAPEAGQSGYEALLAVRNALIAIDTLLAAQAAALGDKASSSHGHAMSAIDGLTAALASKMAADARFALADLSDVDVASIAIGYLLRWDGEKFTASSPQAAIGSHQHLMSDINGLEAAIAQAVTDLVNGSPAALDTLKELADALGNDANFAVTVMSALAGKVAKSGDALSGGFTTTAADDGTFSGTYRPNPGGGNLRRGANDGAFTLAAPDAAGDYTVALLIENGSSAGAVTMSGFTAVKGPAFTTTANHRFMVFITRINSRILANVVALQ